MNAKLYPLLILLFMAIGCDEHGENICEAYPTVLKDLTEKRVLMSEKSFRAPASLDLITWSEGLLKRLQWVRDHLDGSKDREIALRKVTDAVDQTLYLVGYLKQGNRKRGLASLDEVERLLKGAFESGCKK